MHTFFHRFSTGPLLAAAATVLLFAVLLVSSPGATPSAQPSLGSSAPAPETVLAGKPNSAPSEYDAPSGGGTYGWTAWSG